MNLILLLIPVVGAIWYLNQGKEFLEEYKVKFLDAKFDYRSTQDSFFTKLHFIVKFDVINVTDFSGTLQSAKLDVFLANTGKNLGYINLPLPVTINKQSHTPVSIPVQIPTLSLVSNITSIVQMITAAQTIVLQLKGKLVFNIGTLTVNENYPVKLLG